MPDMQALAAEALGGATVQSCTSKQLGRLWAGYGTVTALHATLAGGSEQHLVVKQVDPPHGTGASHSRKLRSYAVEASFYDHCAPALQAAAPALQAAGCCPAALPVPQLLQAQPPSHFLFVLSDLRRQFPLQPHCYDLQESLTALGWLASFHAFWWEEQALPPAAATPPPPPPPPQAAAAAAAAAAGDPVQLPACSGGGGGPAARALAAAQLWPEGGYWHLATRQEELRSMGPRWRDLQAAAPRIDAALRGGPEGQHRTLVHGDFKSENVMFSAGGASGAAARSCAAYDFQYVGGGWGLKDVVYMMCASLDERVCVDHEQQLLSHYRQRLLAALGALGKHSAARRYSEAVMQRHYRLCLLDYVRFMAGWGMWGNSEWAAAKCAEWLPDLEQLL